MKDRTIEEEGNRNRDWGENGGGVRPKAMGGGASEVLGLDMYFCTGWAVKREGSAPRE